jgi:hypothetical protein
MAAAGAGKNVPAVASEKWISVNPMNRIAIPLLTLGLSLTLALCWAGEPNSDQAKSIAEIGNCGGNVTVDEENPGKPARVRRSSNLPTKWDSAHRDAFTDAFQVWRLGKNYFEGGEGDSPHDENHAVVFRGIDEKTRRFLAWPNLQPVVQFGCAGGEVTPYEEALVETLKAGEPALKLQALAILMKLRAPSSVPLQWKALGELRQNNDRPQWQPLLAEWQACFDPQRLERELRQAPRGHGDYESASPTFLWSIRAAGVIQDVRARDRLVTLSTGGDTSLPADLILDTSLAAERSLEDFTGPEANKALVRCVLGWKYDAYVRAGHALLKRDKALLTKVLLEAKAPKNCRFYQGLLLARCDNAAAVPILCEEIPTYQIIDGKMFAQIARLGGAEHREMIQSLPARVRPDQRDVAEHIVQRFMTKLKHRSEQSPSEQAKAIMRMEDLGAEIVMDEKSPGSPVTRLDFSQYSPVTDTDLQFIRGFSQLRELDLQQTQLTDAALPYLKGLVHLEALDLSVTRVTDAGLKHLEGLTCLHSLKLSCCSQVTNAGLEHLEGLTDIRSLDLSFTQATDAGLARLKGLARLQSLTLLGTKVTDAGLEHLKGLTNLQSLGLEQTLVTGVGLVYLRGLTRLHTLALDGAPVSKVGLENLKGLTHLRNLTLYRTEVRDEDLRMLKKALSRCEIRR